MNDEKLDKLATEFAELKVMTGDILEALHAFSANVDKRFDAAHAEIADTRREMADVRRDIRGTEASLRDFIDRRVADGVAEIAPVVRKVDAKDSALVERLAEKKVIAQNDKQEMLALSPFPNV